MPKAYNLQILAKRTLAILKNNNLEKISALQLASYLEVSQITAYKVLYFLQASGYLDQDFNVQKNNVKEALK